MDKKPRRLIDIDLLDKDLRDCLFDESKTYEGVNLALRVLENQPIVLMISSDVVDNNTLPMYIEKMVPVTREGKEVTKLIPIIKEGISL